MTSSINPNNIDGTYPIAGQDNDSQGFRDNFTNIKNNFTFAYDELTDLQSKAVLKSALSGGSLNNDMAYAQLVSAQLLKSVETVNNLGTKTGSFTISWADGHFQYYTTSGNTTLAFSNWPTSAYYTKLRLQITTDTTNRTVTFPAAVSVGLSDIQGAVGQTVTLPTAGVYLFELTTLDNGSTITIQDLLRNYDITTAGNSGVFSTVTVSTLANVTSATNSTSSTTGALLVTGGVGIGGNLNVDGNLTVKGTLRSIFKTYSVKIADDGSGTQEVFFFDNVAIRTNAGVYSNISFFPGQTYRFDLSDASNADGPLRFSTTSDIAVPASITDYTTGVNRSTIAAGNAGAYVDLTVRSDTPSPLYVYAEEANVALDTSNIGGQLPIPIRGTVSTVDATIITGNLTLNGSGSVAGNLNVVGNVLAKSVTTGLLVNNGNVVIADPINAGSWGSNLTIKGTIHRKYRWYSNLVVSSEAISLSPGGDQLLLVETSGNLDVGYNLPITPGSTVELTVKQTGGNAYVKLPNANNNLAKANVYVLGGSYTRFVFTSFGTDSANVVVDTNGLA